MVDTVPMPLAANNERWAFAERSELGEHGSCFYVFRSPGEAPELAPQIAGALPLLLHEFERQEGLQAIFEHFAQTSSTPTRTILRRILPRLVSYRFVESRKEHEFFFEGSRASSVHVLPRVLETDYRFRLEDLSHFATHVEHLLGVLNAAGLKRALEPESILYCPSLDSPYPFKFAVVGDNGPGNRQVYVSLLKQLLRTTEADETFRERNFRELARGFEKFGPAAATPGFQEVELKVWRLLTYLAARLRVKAGRLTDTRELSEVRGFLRELREVHEALDALVHLPSRLAAHFRRRFDLELSELTEHALPELEAIAQQIDCDLTRPLSIDEKASLISEFRRMGSAAPIQCLNELDHGLKLAYGDVEVEALEPSFVRTYTEVIFTGTERFDTRRYDKEQISGDLWSESDFELDVSLDLPGFLNDDEDEVDVDAEDEGDYESDAFGDLLDGTFDESEDELEDPSARIPQIDSNDLENSFDGESYQSEDFPVAD